MYDQEQIIQIYCQGFFICAGLSVVGGIMTTIFFWKFGIRRIIAVRTGYEARKEIRRIEEENRKKETKTSDVFVLKKNVMMVHTNEVIERDGGRS